MHAANFTYICKRTKALEKWHFHINVSCTNCHNLLNTLPKVCICNRCENDIFPYASLMTTMAHFHSPNSPARIHQIKRTANDLHMHLLNWVVVFLNPSSDYYSIFVYGVWNILQKPLTLCHILFGTLPSSSASHPPHQCSSWQSGMVSMTKTKLQNAANYTNMASLRSLSVPQINWWSPHRTTTSNVIRSPHFLHQCQDLQTSSVFQAQTG